MNENISDEFPEHPEETNKPRKKKVNKANWKKNVDKLKRYSAKAERQPTIACAHNSHFCSAKRLRTDDLLQFHAAFCCNKDARGQRSFLMNYIDVKMPDRRRPGQGKSDRSSKNISSTFHVQTTKGPVKVCRKTFLSILNVGRRQVENAANDKLNLRFSTPERRGGARQRPAVVLRRAKVIAHIKKFKCRSIHYGRKKAPLRKYLPSELNVRRMWKMFCEEEQSEETEDHCDYYYYHQVFTSTFNLGFDSVKKDTCNDCMALSTKFKAATDINVKKRLIAERMVHVFKANKFFKCMNENPPETIDLNFDLMQNQPVPKTQINQAYYSRQVWYYILGIVIHTPTKELNHDTVHFFRWLESDGGRGCDEISSCLWDFFVKCIRPKCVADNVKTIRMFSDSCVGQNRNYCMLNLFGVIASQFDLKVEWYFPVRGHSYMPADRAFGLVETQLRDISTVLLPEEYDEVFSRVGTLHVLGKDFNWLNFQNLSDKATAAKKTFKISRAKKISIYPETGLIGVRETYMEPLCKHSIMKKGMTYRNILLSLAEKARKNHVSEKKKKDVVNLLKVMGYDHTALPFFNEILELPSCGTMSGINDNSMPNTSSDSDSN